METVNNVHTTRWRHMECDNEPQHVQEFADGIQGDYGPAAGDRCGGCGRPTALYDWVQIVDKNPCICGTPGTGNFDGPLRDCPVHGEP